MIGWVLLIGLVLVIALLIGMYNTLVRLKVQVDNAWADIDVQLRRRYDLIPNLVETPLLKLSTYNTLLEAPEFQDLTDSANTSTAWVCPALAAFLHALDALGDYRSSRRWPASGHRL